MAVSQKRFCLGSTLSPGQNLVTEASNGKVDPSIKWKTSGDDKKWIGRGQQAENGNSYLNNGALNLLFEPWCTTNKDIEQANMVSNITGVNNIKCKVWRETICTQRKSIASPQANLETKTEQAMTKATATTKSKKKRFNSRNNFSSPLLHKNVTIKKEFPALHTPHCLQVSRHALLENVCFHWPFMEKHTY